MDDFEKFIILSLGNEIKRLHENKHTLDSMLLDVYLWFNAQPSLQDNLDIIEDIRIYLEDDGLI